MEYKVALVNALGAVVGELAGAALHPHGSDTTILDRNVPGLGRKGDSVRLPSPAEHPQSADDLAGHRLALVGTTPDGETILHIFDALAGAVGVDSEKMTQLANDVARAFQLLNELRADVAALKASQPATA